MHRLGTATPGATSAAPRSPSPATISLCDRMAIVVPPRSVGIPCCVTTLESSDHHPPGGLHDKTTTARAARWFRHLTGSRPLQAVSALGRALLQGTSTRDEQDYPRALAPRPPVGIETPVNRKATMPAVVDQASGAASGESTGSEGSAPPRRSSMVRAVHSMASMTRRRSLSPVVGRLSTLANATMALAA
jgi:hypothetical protein